MRAMPAESVYTVVGAPWYEAVEDGYQVYVRTEERGQFLMARYHTLGSGQRLVYAVDQAQNACRRILRGHFIGAWERTAAAGGLVRVRLRGRELQVVRD